MWQSIEKDLKPNTSICLEGLAKPTNTLSQNSWYQCQDSDRCPKHTGWAHLSFVFGSSGERLGNLCSEYTYGHLGFRYNICPKSVCFRHESKYVRTNIVVTIHRTVYSSQDRTTSLLSNLSIGPWRVLGSRTEGRPPVMEVRISSRGQTTRGGPPAWGWAWG
jgi:hypothetical protein